jgi:proteasome accessory factor B
MRMFERDKDELRSFGIDIATSDISDDDGDTQGYRLDRKTFYLPYLSLTASGTKLRKIEKHWYRALANLAFEPDDLAIIAGAAQRVRQLGDPVLSEDVESAIRKLSFDLPLPSAEANETPTIVAERMPAEDVFEILDDALTRKKRVTFRYHSLSSDQESQRTVEPYGLFFLSSHWYLAARLVDSGEMRNFRLSRIRDVRVNAARAQSADYEIPATFKLREHARSRHPWELGETDANEAIVDFRGERGALKAAARLGMSVEGGSDRRKFRIKRQDSFARWLLSFGGGAIPVSPPSLVDEFKRQIAATSALYAARA